MILTSEYAPEQFINNGLTRVPGGAAFIYLFRRYGYPNYYSFKTVAGYLVETPMVGVYVDFAIKSETCWISATANDDLYIRYGREESKSRRDNYSKFCQQVHTAVHNCLLDQLRPVKVDDEYINILGVGEFEWDEKAEQMVGQVPYYALKRGNNGHENGN